MKSERKTVLFYPSVGPGLGLGNFMRCVTLSRLLHDTADIYFLLPSIFTIDRHISDVRFHRISIDEIEKVLPQCNALVFDQQGQIDAGSVFARIRTIVPDISIIALDYFFLHEKNVDVFINLSEYQITKRQNFQKLIYYTGLDYAIIRPEFYPFRTEVRVKKVVENVLITFGGEDISGWTFKVIKWLERHIEEKLQVTVILGAMNASRKKIEQIVNECTNHEYVILNHVKNVAQYMSKCDLAFCGGGTTIMELAYLGKSVIALPQHEMERDFLYLFERNGFLLSGMENSFRKICSYPFVSLFRNVAIREKVSRIGRQLIDGNGVKRIIQIIIESLQKKTN